jgi:hypothetical protein
MSLQIRPVMPSVNSSIQAVLNLRGSCSGELPADVMKAIDHVHTMITEGTHADGWKKVRNGQGGGGGFGRNFRSGGSGGNSGSNSNQPRTGSNTQAPAFNRSTWNGAGSGSMNNDRIRNLRGASDAPTKAAPFTKQQTAAAPSPAPTPAPARFSGGAPRSQGPPIKYVSIFKTEGEDKEKIILNSIIQGKLNKFSEGTYADVKGFLQQILDGDQQDFLKAFMELVFQMAADQEAYCPLYARLLGELSAEYPVLLTEMNKLHTQYLNVFANVENKESPNDDYNAFVRQNKEKKYRLGYSQFIAELVRLNIIENDVLFSTLTKILGEMETRRCQEGQSSLLEEYSDCMVRMMKAFTSTDSHIASRRKDILEAFGDKIRSFTVITPDAVSIKPKIKFAMMNIMDILTK